MIEKWLTEDIQKAFDQGCLRFVLSDPNGEAGYLCKHLPKNWTVKEAHTDLEELEAKYHVEKDNTDKPVVFYTHIPIEKLNFLMEYAMTHGHLDLSQFHQYIKKKVHAHIGLNLNIGKEELLTAAKVSIGKEKSYWMDLSHKGAKEIFDLKTMLPEFLNDPKGFANKMDGQVKAAFFSNVQESTGQQIINKPAGTLAKETINLMLSGLANNKIDDLFNTGPF